MSETALVQMDLNQTLQLGEVLAKSGFFSDAKQASQAVVKVLAGRELGFGPVASMVGVNIIQGKPAIGELAFGRAVSYAADAGDTVLSASVSVDRARALVALGRNDEAAKALAEARTSDPANARAWLLSATLSRRLERLGEAQEQIAQAATLAPQDPAVGLEAGVIAALSGREEEARRSFDSVLLVAPESDEATRARAYLEQLKP